MHIYAVYNTGRDYLSSEMTGGIPIAVLYNPNSAQGLCCKNHGMIIKKVEFHFGSEHASG